MSVRAAQTVVFQHGSIDSPPIGCVIVLRRLDHFVSVAYEATVAVEVLVSNAQPVGPLAEMPLAPIYEPRSCE